MGELELHSPPFVGGDVSSAPSYCRAGPGICEFSRGRLFRHSGDSAYGDCALPEARFGEIAEIRPVCRKSRIPGQSQFSEKPPIFAQIAEIWLPAAQPGGRLFAILRQLPL